MMYVNEKNSSRVFEIYEHLFELKQGDKSVAEFYGEPKSLVDDLEMHQPAITDATTLRGYRQDLAMSKFLSGLSPTLKSQLRGHILRGDSIPTLTITFSRVMCVSTGANVSSASSIDQSFMYSRRGRGRDHGRGQDFGGGRGLFGAGRNVPDRRLNMFDKGLRHCTRCGRNNHIFEKCWTKFGRPE